MICWDRRSFPTESAKISTWQRKVRNGDNPAMLLRFNSYELDKGRRELRLDDVSVHVEPQVLDLLIYLVANRDHVVSKEEMIEGVWGGRIVSDVTLNSGINAVRRAVG